MSLDQSFGAEKTTPFDHEGVRSMREDNDNWIDLQKKGDAISFQSAVTLKLIRFINTLPRNESETSLKQYVANNGGIVTEKIAEVYVVRRELSLPHPEITVNPNSSSGYPDRYWIETDTELEENEWFKELGNRCKNNGLTLHSYVISEGREIDQGLYIEIK